MWGVPIRLAERTSRSIDIERWRVLALRGASSDGCGGAECGDGVERCRYLDRNELTGPLPAELANLNQLLFLYVHIEGLNCGRRL